MNIKQSFNTFKKNKELFLLSLPAVVFIFIFSYLPLYGLILPFKNYRYDLGLFKSEWVGLKNFDFLFQSDNAIRITRNTVLLNSAFIFTTLVVSLIFALMLYELTKKWVKVYQTIMFFPYFLSWVVVSYVVLGLLDMEHGFVNSILAGFGKEAVLWYNNPKYWPAILVICNIWKGAGYSAVIYYAALLGVDGELYESAELDGASKIQQARMISIPMITPLIIIMVLLSIGKIFYGNFDLFFNVTRDSAALYPVTDVIDTFVYRSLRTVGDIGMSSAAGVYQSVVGFVIVVVTNVIIKKMNPENSLF